jgi:hypothetical protein
MKNMIKICLAAFLISFAAKEAFGTVTNLSVNIDSVTGVTATAVYVNLNLTGTNGTGSNVTARLFWGRADNATNAGSWTYSNSVSTSVLGSISFHITNLLSGYKYYTKGQGTETTNIVWSGASSNFTTLSGYSTSVVPLGYHAVMVNSNGVVVAPSNFGTANGFNATSDVSALVAYTNYANGKFTTNDTNISNINISVSALTNSVSNTIDRVVVLEGAGSSRYFARTNASDTIEVFATGTGISVARTNSTFYWSIPAGKHIYSYQQRVDGSYTDGGSIYHSFGTNDVNNTSASTDWVPIPHCYREDSLANVPVTARPYSVTPSLVVISGMGTTPGVIYHLRGGM